MEDEFNLMVELLLFLILVTLLAAHFPTVLSSIAYTGEIVLAIVAWPLTMLARAVRGALIATRRLPVGTVRASRTILHALQRTLRAFRTILVSPFLTFSDTWRSDRAEG